MEDNNNKNSNDQKENLIIEQNQFPNKIEIENNNQKPNYIPPLININNDQQQAMAYNPPTAPIQYPPQHHKQYINNIICQIKSPNKTIILYLKQMPIQHQLIYMIINPIFL